MRRDHLLCKVAYVLDRHLVAKPIGTLNSVTYVTLAVILGHVCRSAIGASLRVHRVDTLVMYAFSYLRFMRAAAVLGPAPHVTISTASQR